MTGGVLLVQDDNAGPQALSKQSLFLVPNVSLAVGTVTSVFFNPQVNASSISPVILSWLPPHSLNELLVAYIVLLQKFRRANYLFQQIQTSCVDHLGNVGN